MLWSLYSFSELLPLTSLQHPCVANCHSSTFSFWNGCSVQQNKLQFPFTVFCFIWFSRLVDKGWSYLTDKYMKFVSSNMQILCFLFCSCQHARTNAKKLMSCRNKSNQNKYYIIRCCSVQAFHTLKCWYDNWQYASVFSDECTGNESCLCTARGLMFDLLCFCLFLTGSHYKYSADATGIFVWLSVFRIYPSVATLGKKDYVWMLGRVYFIFQVCSLLF